MKRLLLIILVIFGFSRNFAQYRDREIFKPSIKEEIINDNPDFILGIIDPSKFTMSHSYSMSYSSFGGNGMALGVYTNSMFYRFSERLNLEVDASFVHSPFNSFGKDFQNTINGVYLNRAQLNYSPWDNLNISLLYRQVPTSFYYDSPFSQRRSVFSPYSIFDY